MTDHPSPSVSDSVSLPIEGHMAWPFVIRLIVFASIFVVAVLGSVLVLMMPEGQSTMRVEMLAIAFAVVLLFEMVLVRRFIVPLNGDYGRFIIRGGTVDFYPLSALGMSVSNKPETVPITEFSGVSVQVLEAKGAVTRYGVVLIHPKRGRMIRVRSYLLRSEAEDYARALANLLSLKMI